MEININRIKRRYLVRKMIIYLYLIVGSILIIIGGCIGYYIGVWKALSITRELNNYIENDFIDGIMKTINNKNE